MFSQTRNFTVIPFPGWIYCIENFFTLPWETVFREIFHCIEYILLPFRIFEQPALALNSRVCPERQSCPEIFHCIEYIFIFRIFEHLALALKNRMCPEFTTLNMFLSFRIFEHLALALKNRVDLKIFPVLKIFLSFRTFEQLALALKTEFALNSLYWIYICYHSGFLNNLRLPWKTQIALKFFTVLKYFLSFRIFEHLVLALKTWFSLKLFKTGGRPPPTTPCLVRLCSQRCTGSGFQDSSPAGFSSFWTNLSGPGLRFYSSFRIRIFKFHFLAFDANTIIKSFFAKI